MDPGRSRRALAGLVLVLGSLGLAGCTARSDSAPVPTQSPSPSPPEVTRATGLDVRARVTRVAGDLSDPRRRQLSRSVRTVVAAYLDAAFLEGGGDLPGFTASARSLARRDLDVLSAEGLGGVDRVQPRPGRPAHVYVAAVAAHGRAVGATARLSLDLAVTTDGASAPARLRGRLVLTPTDRGWRIFGYDLALAGPATGTTERAVG